MLEFGLKLCRYDGEICKMKSCGRLDSQGNVFVCPRHGNRNGMFRKSRPKAFTIEDYS